MKETGRERRDRNAYYELYKALTSFNGSPGSSVYVDWHLAWAIMASVTTPSLSRQRICSSSSGCYMQCTTSTISASFSQRSRPCFSSLASFRGTQTPNGSTTRLSLPTASTAHGWPASSLAPYSCALPSRRVGILCYLDTAAQPSTFGLEAQFPVSSLT